MNSTLFEKRYRSKFIQKDENGNLICYKCKTYKSEECFYNSNVTGDSFYRGGKSKSCKNCAEEQRKKRQIQNRGKGNLDRVLLERWHSAKTRSKSNGLVIDFTWEYLKDLWNKQSGKCAISNLEMTHEIFNGRVNTNVSVDRIDSTKGYIKGNVQLVCMAVNQIKNDLKIDELLYFCYNILKAHKHES